MNKKLSRQQEELRRKQTRRYAELTSANQAIWSSTPPRLPRQPGQTQALSREEEVRRAWAITPANVYGVHRGLGNSAVRSILGSDLSAARDEGVTPGQQLLASLLSADEAALDAAGEPPPTEAAGSDAAADADTETVTVHDPAAGLDVTYDLGGGAPEVDLKQVDQQLGGGRPLDAETREYMEWRFGLNLSSVRIHTGPKADALSKALMAHAFALGNQVAFAGGQYRPGTAHGDFLLAHELTHVVQAGHATPLAEDARKSSSVSEPSDAIEVQADQVAAEVTSVPRSEFAKARREGLLGPGIEEDETKARRRYAPAPTARRAAGLVPAPARSPASAARSGPTKASEPARARSADSPGTLLQDAAASPGRPLPENLKGRLEALAGMSLGGVRIHDDGASHVALAAIGAEAAALGADLLFGPGRFQPGTRVGDELIAHEVMHVVQSGEGRPAPATSQVGDVAVTSRGDASEREAAAFASAFVAAHESTEAAPLEAAPALRRLPAGLTARTVAREGDDPVQKKNLNIEVAPAAWGGKKLAIDGNKESGKVSLAVKPLVFPEGEENLLGGKKGGWGGDWKLPIQIPGMPGGIIFQAELGANVSIGGSIAGAWNTFDGPFADESDFGWDVSGSAEAKLGGKIEGTLAVGGYVGIPPIHLSGQAYVTLTAECSTGIEGGATISGNSADGPTGGEVFMKLNLNAGLKATGGIRLTYMALIDSGEIAKVELAEFKIGSVGGGLKVAYDPVSGAVTDEGKIEPKWDMSFSHLFAQPSKDELRTLKGGVAATVHGKMKAAIDEMYSRMVCEEGPNKSEGEPMSYAPDHWVDQGGEPAPGAHSGAGDYQGASGAGSSPNPGNAGAGGSGGVQQKALPGGASPAVEPREAVQAKQAPIQRVPVRYAESHKSMFERLEDATAGLTPRQHGSLQSSLTWTGNLFAYAVPPSPQWQLLLDQCEMLERDLLHVLGDGMTMYATAKLAPGLQSTYAARGLVEGGMKPHSKVAKDTGKHVSSCAFQLGQLGEHGIWVDLTGSVTVKTDEELEALIKKSIEAEPKPPDMPIEQWEGGLTFKPYTVAGTEIRVSNRGGEQRFKLDNKPLSGTQSGSLMEMKSLMYRDTAFDEGPVTRDRLVDMAHSIDKWKSILEQIAGEGIGTKAGAVVAKSIAKLEIAHGMVIAKLQPLADLLRMLQGRTAEIHGAIQTTLDIRPFKQDPDNPDQARLDRWRREFGDEGEKVQGQGPMDGAVAIHEAAARGAEGVGGALPFLDTIQEAFGGHDVSGIEAHVGSRAAEAAEQIGALAFARGNAVVFGDTPDLHTAAHEAAHVFQQAQGVHLPGGVGEAGDVYERQADAVADAVVRGQSAEPLLDSIVGTSSSASRAGAEVQNKAVQRDGGDGPVIEIVSNFMSPWSLQDQKMKPAVLTTYDDAATLAGDAWGFVDRISQYVDQADPRYQAVLSASDALDAKMVPWSGDQDRLVLKDGQALAQVLASAENTIYDFSTDLSVCWIGANWDFPKLKISLTGDLVLHQQKDVASLARKVQARLKPILAILETGPSKHIGPLEKEIKAWAKIQGDFKGGQNFTIPSTFDPVQVAWDSTEALLTELNALPVRGQALKMGKPFSMNGTYNISTYEAAANFVGDVGSELFFRHSDLFPSDESPAHQYAASYESWRNNWDAFTDTVSEWGKAARDWELGISDAQAKEIGSKIKDLEKHLGWMQDAFKADLRRAKIDAARAKRDAIKTAKEAAYAQRTAFLTNASDSDLAFFTNTILGLGGLANEINTAQQAMGGWGGGRVDLLLKTKLPGLAMKGMNIANVINGWASSTTMTKGTAFEGMAALSNAVSVAGLVMTPAMSLFTAHIGPMLSAITAMMGRLQAGLIKLNDMAAEMGMDGQYYPGADPGGEPMWIFMTAVMHGSVPTPPSSVIDYFESFNGKLGAATKSTVPMDDGVLGSGFFQDLEVARFKKWVLIHRSTVWACLYGGRPVPAQKAGGGTDNEEVVQAAARRGLDAPTTSLPHGAAIQKSFGKHDVSGIAAHAGPKASQATEAMGARAYATGKDVVFGKTPDLHTAAHEAAHVVQQAHGVSLAGGVGKAGDRYEQHADAVADAVVQGKSAEPILDTFTGDAGARGVQRKSLDGPVQLDGADQDDTPREPKGEELTCMDEGASAVSQGESAASGELGSPDSPTAASLEDGPPQSTPGPDGFGDLMSIDPGIDMSVPPMPVGPTSAPSERAVDQVLDAVGPGHSAPAESSGGLLGAAWGVATTAFQPLVGYNKNRGGWQASNFLNIGPSIDGVIDAYKRDRGEGFWATVAETADVVRSVAKGVQSVCGAVGLVTRVLSLVGLFPPLAPVGAFLASVSSICSTVSFIAGIVAAATQFIAMIAQAVMLVQGVKDGAPNVLEMYAQYQEDVGNFLSDGIAVAVDLVFKKVGKKFGQSSGAKKGMGNYRDVLATADGRVARGAAFRALKDVGAPNLAGNLLSTAGSTRAALTRQLAGNVFRATTHNIALTTIKSPIKGGIKGGFSSAGKTSAAEVRADATRAAASKAASAPAPATADAVARLVERVPNQPTPPAIPAPTHSPTELDELQQRRQEIAAAMAHVEAVRSEGFGAIEAGEELMCQAESHEESATEMDQQVERHSAGAQEMEGDAVQGISDVERGEQKNAEMGQQGGQIQNEAEGAQSEGSGVDVPAPKPAKSWWGRLKAWFKEKVFDKVKKAFQKVNEFIASIVLKAVAGLMGVDDIEGKLAEARAGLVTAQGAAQETGQRTQQVGQQAGEAHAQASEASSAAQTAISEGQSTVSEADSLLAQLQSEEQRLQSEAVTVQSETDAYRDQWGECIDEASVGGPPADPAILSGIEAAIESTSSSIDGLEDQASTIGQEARDAVVADARAAGMDPAVLLEGVAAPLEDQFVDLCSHYDGHRSDLAALSAEMTSLSDQPYALIEEQLGRITGEVHGIAGCADSDFESFRRTVAAAMGDTSDLVLEQAAEVAQEDSSEQSIQDAGMSQAESGIQRKGSRPAPSGAVVQQAAVVGTADAGGPLPFRAQIQKSFGKHDVSAVKAHTGSAATQASQAMGAKAFATGNSVAFAGSPDLHTAAHEAAHVVQQKQGVSLKGGVGKAGDVYEKQADAVADAVVAGRSAEPLLSRPARGAAGVQRQAVQLDGEEREPESKEDGSYAKGEPAVGQAESAAPPAGGDKAPKPPGEQPAPPPPIPGSAGPDELMCVDPTLPDPGVSMPAGPTTDEPSRVVETMQETRGPTHSAPAKASSGLLGAAWNVTTDAFGPLVGYKRSRGGWKASNFLNLGPSWDGIVGAAKNDRGGGLWGNLARGASTVRSIAEGIRSVCSAVGLVTRVLSLVGLFPPLAPVGAFLATVSSICSTVTWIAAIVATCMSALTMVFSAIQLVQGIKDGSPKAADLYKQFSKDVSTFVGDGIGLLVDKAFKAKKMGGKLGSQSTAGMKSYKDVLKVADGRSARGMAFQGLKSMGGPHFAGNLLSVKGTTRQLLTSYVKSDLTRVAVKKVGVDLVKRELKQGLKDGGKALSGNLMALGNTSVIEAAGKRAATPATQGLGDAVKKALESTPDQTAPPVIPEPTHSPVEMDELQGQRGEIAKARLHVDGVRAEGIAAIEGGEGLQSEADKHESSATELDGQVKKQQTDLTGMDKQADSGLKEIDKGQGETGKAGDSGKKAESEGGKAKGEGSGVAVPKPKKATSWWGRLKAWFKEKVFSKVKKALAKVQGFIADIILKAVAGIMGIDDIDAKLDEVKAGMQVAQEKNKETRAGTVKVAGDSKKAHADAGKASADAGKAIAKGRKTVAEADAMDARLQAEDAKLAAEATQVQSDTTSYKDAHGADIDEAARGGAPVDPAVLAGYAASVDAAIGGLDRLEDQAATIGQSARDALTEQAKAAKFDPSVLSAVTGEIEGHFTELTGRMDGRRGRLATLSAAVLGFEGQPYAVIEAQLGQLGGDIHSIAGEADADVAAFGQAVSTAMQEAAALWRAQAAEVIAKKQKVGVLQRKAASAPVQKMTHAPVQMAGGGDERAELKTEQRKTLLLLRRIVGKNPKKIQKRRVWKLILAVVANWGDHLVSDIKPEPRLTKMAAETILQVTRDPLRPWFQRAATTGKVRERDLKKASRYLKTPKFIGLAEDAEVQKSGGGSGRAGVHEAAAAGTSGAGGPMPFQSQIQKSFGKHDVSGIKAHTGSDAKAASASMGARAFATGNDVAFGGSPDLHTAAHEAAHVVQQRRGVNLAGGVGKAGDKYEQHADKVASAVVSGRSAEALLEGGTGRGSGGVQREEIQLKGLGQTFRLQGSSSDGRAEVDLTVSVQRKTVQRRPQVVQLTPSEQVRRLRERAESIQSRIEGAESVIEGLQGAGEHLEELGESGWDDNRLITAGRSTVAIGQELASAAEGFVDLTQGVVSLPDDATEQLDRVSSALDAADAFLRILDDTALQNFRDDPTPENAQAWATSVGETFTALSELVPESLERYPLLNFPLRMIRGYLSAPAAYIEAFVSIINDYTARIDASIGFFESPTGAAVAPDGQVLFRGPLSRMYCLAPGALTAFMRAHRDDGIDLEEASASVAFGHLLHLIRESDQDPETRQQWIEYVQQRM